MNGLKLFIRIFVIILAVAAVGFSYHLFSIAQDRNQVIDDFEDKRNLLITNSNAMNAIIEEYDDPSIISLRRLELIDEYITKSPDSITLINDFYSFIESNEESLSKAGVDCNKLKSDIIALSESIKANIGGFRNDLVNMDSAFLISASKDKQDYRQDLENRIDLLKLDYI